MKEFVLSLGLWVTLTGCARSPHAARPSETTGPGPNLIRNGVLEAGEKDLTPWSLTLHSYSRHSPPTMSVVLAPEDEDRESKPGPKKPEGGHALEINLPGPWNVVRILQEIPEGAARSPHRLEGFVRVSKEFEGSIQAILSANAGISIPAFAKRAWFNVDGAESVFVPFMPWWHRFALNLPCADEGKTTLVLLVEGKGRLWIDDLEVRRK